MAQQQLRQYDAHAQSTDTFGRVLCSVRDHHFIVDGPVQNGAPGEEVTPGELFLAAVATCGVELVQVIAREQGVPLQAVSVAISGLIDLVNPVRPDVTLFNSVKLDFLLKGVSDEQGAPLIDSFKRR
jgi:uncharacterized OsmC-like protein